MDDSPAFETDTGTNTDADWQDAYRAILDACLPNCLSVADGAATVPRANALAGLGNPEPSNGESSDDDLPDAERAEERLSSLDAAGAVECDGDSVAVLFDPEADRELTSERWRVAADALAAEIERLDAEALDDDGANREEEIDEKIETIAAEIRDMTADDGMPDVDDLDADQRERFRNLKEEFVYYRNLREANTDPTRALAPTLADRTDRLGDLPDRADDALAEFETAVEATAALRQAVDSDDSAVIRERVARLVEVLDG
ncbi:hypothetical protein M0R88_16850 [Halorussus gelatinilyticus]|uniref:Uncharacterized protein n=1 Tax=Halorussus gelatinilyticus TaxID=2937524 RepID=A0A8U0IJC2_9EURY|nr:hypothetical protein [Halorussus gelatinilyticus]UPW00169.1 hypothetical protein M0R88_16850 [Halorussus gelatinilyticus]